jgi:hypothetical protein
MEINPSSKAHMDKSQIRMKKYYAKYARVLALLE